MPEDHVERMREAIEQSAHFRSEVLVVEVGTLEALLTEVKHIREHVTILQDRGTKLIEENRALRKRIDIVEAAADGTGG